MERMEVGGSGGSAVYYTNLKQHKASACLLPDLGAAKPGSGMPQN
jgi:hypothetical protein